MFHHSLKSSIVPQSGAQGVNPIPGERPGISEPPVRPRGFGRLGARSPLNTPKPGLWISRAVTRVLLRSRHADVEDGFEEVPHGVVVAGNQPLFRRLTAQQCVGSLQPFVSVWKVLADLLPQIGGGQVALTEKVAARHANSIIHGPTSGITYCKRPPYRLIALHNSRAEN